MLASHMAHEGTNEHKRNQGKTRLAIRSRRNHSRCSLPPHGSSLLASTPHRHSIGPRRFPNKTRHLDEFSRSATRPTETTSLMAHFLIANARLKLTATHSKINPLKTPNRERIAFSTRNFSNRRTPGSARHSSFITRQFLSNRNSRITGFQLTPLATVLTQFLTATNPPFSRLSFFVPSSPLLTSQPHLLHQFSFHGIIGLLCLQ
jgi:hypothetical protein